MNEIQSSNSNKVFYSPKELAEYLSVSIATVYRLVARRQVPFHKIGGCLRFRREDIDKFLDKTRINPILR